MDWLTSLIPVPLLVFGFFVLVGTIAGVTWLHLRDRPRRGLDNAPVATPEPWLHIPYLDAFFNLPRHLPGMYRPIGTWIGTLVTLLSGACFAWDASGAGLIIAIISNYYMEQAMERAFARDSNIPGLVYSITVLVVGVIMALVHAALLLRRYLG